ncbi:MULTISPECIES: hypothetical protein [unclassified Bacillus (in: firmicutes)]|uniref:hypothetical protein n=1 Tax=unclassified Bacillus (in: firmicutes) TaxID=185979 RepID=UPI0008E5BF33|nr:MULTISPECIES: hypothetical protein [unclassified Bacillus (in: firmicutes)]SFA81625.1 hypothetical protein SAMN02799634_1011048 [Bacillus sp. UNCCL13]SFQ71703.1 hypothetical protein SAMN04488577_1322 [Bacillus sp. cl95]
MKNPELDRNHTPENSSMAPNLEEMENLGKQMENRRTNQELKEDYGKKPDPIQHEKADE